MIMEKIQRFGGAMFTPVLLFSFSGIMVALCIIFKNPMLVGVLLQKEQHGIRSGQWLKVVLGPYSIKWSCCLLLDYLSD